jgi:hypothetical protein
MAHLKSIDEQFSKLLKRGLLCFAYGSMLWLVPVMRVHAQAKLPSDVDWHLSTQISTEAISKGLPVLVLDQDHWGKQPRQAVKQAAGLQSIDIKTMAEHASGFQFGLVWRSRVGLQANADTVDLAAAIDTKSQVQTNRVYDIQAKSQGWKGLGIAVALPWQPLHSNWQWQVGAQGLRLQKLKAVDASGFAEYNGTNTYTAKLDVHEAGTGVKGPFLPESSTKGWGLTSSLALKGRLTSDWHVHMQVNDIWSKLQWSKMAQQQSHVDTQTLRQSADGLIDYLPAVTGRQFVGKTQKRIGAKWHVNQTWGFQNAQNWQAHMDVVRYTGMGAQSAQWLGVGQNWLSQVDASNARQTCAAWRVSYELQRGVTAIDWACQGLMARWASDRKGSASQYRSLVFAVDMRF